MSCQDFDSVSVELARGSLIDAAARASALAHAEGCAACGGRLRRERALSDALGEVAAAMRDAQASARVESALLAAFRERRAAAIPGATGAVIPAATIESVRARRETRRDAMRRAGVSRRALVSAAVAASLVVVASVVAWRTLSAKTKVVVETARQQAGEREVKSPNQTPQTDVARVPDDVPTASHVVKQDQASRVAYVAHNLARRRAPRTVADLPISFTEHAGRVYADAATNSAVDPGASEGFVPLMTADSSTPLDGGQMVRVQMPRAALAAWGLPVNAERAGETVKADLLLAHDGTARAIRLRR